MKKLVFGILIISLFFNGYLVKQNNNYKEEGVSALGYQAEVGLMMNLVIFETLEKKDLEDELHTAYLYARLIQAQHAANTSNSLTNLTKEKYSEIRWNMAQLATSLNKYQMAAGRLAGLVETSPSP